MGHNLGQITKYASTAQRTRAACGQPCRSPDYLSGHRLTGQFDVWPVGLTLVWAVVNPPVFLVGH